MVVFHAQNNAPIFRREYNRLLSINHTADSIAITSWDTLFLLARPFSQHLLGVQPALSGIAP